METESHKLELGAHQQETTKDGEIQGVSQAMEKDKTASTPLSTFLLQTHGKHQTVQQKGGGFKDKGGGCGHPLLWAFLAAACRLEHLACKGAIWEIRVEELITFP